MIFKQSVQTGVFPSGWKMGNIDPIHKKEDKQTLENNNVQCLCYLFVEKLLRDSKCLNLLLKINFR